MTLPRSALLLALLALAAVPATAQDTRGGLLPDSLLTMADGSEIQAQDVVQGAMLRSVTEGAVGAVKLTAIRKLHTDTYYLLKTADREIHATGSQRVVLADGRVVRLDTVKAGDRVLMTTAKGAEPAAVTSVRVLPATLVAYDLTVDGHRFFVVGGLVVAD